MSFCVFEAQVLYDAGLPWRRAVLRFDLLDNVHAWLAVYYRGLNKWRRVSGYISTTVY